MRGTPAKTGGRGGELLSSLVVAATRRLGKTQSLENYVLWGLRMLRLVVAATAEIAGSFAASG